MSLLLTDSLAAQTANWTVIQTQQETGNQSSHDPVLQWQTQSLISYSNTHRYRHYISGRITTSIYATFLPLPTAIDVSINITVTRRPASADTTARDQFQATGQPVSRAQASDAMTSRLPRYEAKCVQRRCFQCGLVPLRSAITGTELPPANILIPLERQLTALISVPLRVFI